MNVAGKLEAFPGIVMLPASVLPESTAEKLHPCSTPTVSDESVSDESVRVIETGEQATPGSVTHPLQAPATVRAAVVTGGGLLVGTRFAS